MLLSKNATGESHYDVAVLLVFWTVLLTLESYFDDILGWWRAIEMQMEKLMYIVVSQWLLATLTTGTTFLLGKTATFVTRPKIANIGFFKICQRSIFIFDGVVIISFVSLDFFCALFGLLG